MELDGKGGSEALNGKGVVFAGEVAGEICRGNVGDCLFVDANRLWKKRCLCQQLMGKEDKIREKIFNAAG